MAKEKTKKAKPKSELELRQSEQIRRIEQAGTDQLERMLKAQDHTEVFVAFVKAAHILAPHFGVTSAFKDQKIEPKIDDVEMLVEILCSAAAWLAQSRGMDSKKLLASFKRWLAEQEEAFGSPR